MYVYAREYVHARVARPEKGGRKRRGLREIEKERDAPGHEVGELREGRSLPLLLQLLFCPTIAVLYEDTRGTFSHSFSAASL